MPYLPRHIRLWFCVSAACLLFETSYARSQFPAPETPSPLSALQCDQNNRSPYRDCFIGNLYLRGTSFDIALDVCIPNNPGQRQSARQQVCLPDLLKKLGSMPVWDRCGAKKIDELLLRQKITEMIVTASLEVDGFLAQIDNESNHIREVKDHLTDQQSKHLSQSSLASNVGTGGGAVGSALGIGAATATAGSWVGAIFGGVGSVFGFVNYFETLKSPKGCFPKNGDTKNGDKSCKPFFCTEYGTAERGCSPTMLFHVFNPPKQDSEPDQTSIAEPYLFHSKYDPVIQSYLEDRTDNRRQELLESWKGSSEGQEKLTANQNAPIRLSIDELADRQNKLADLRALVARINRDLSRLSYDVTMGLAPCPGDNGN